ncbi:MAG: NAD-dependent epimerase/dehydratase family protein [Desulfobacteraceae bacterium]|nr:MAG: NAD-dependent epimerase/dehydratase family protein [Desulfobacteraceae bacterium]
MRILITGGAGFIGSHLAEAYLENGNEVYIIDNLSTGSLDNLAHLKERSAYQKRLFVHVDSILNRDVMLELVGTCDIVHHLAAAVGVEFILDHPMESITTNIQGTEVVLELCNKFKKRVLIASTSEVYGKHTHAPLVETDNIIYGPSSKFRWSYAASKLMDEFMALAYYRTTGLKVCIVRLFNTVGPRQTGAYGMVIPRLVGQALRNEPLTVYGDGNQTRTFTYVKDVVGAFVRLVENEDAFGQVLNIGGIEEISILALARRIIAACDSSSEIQFIPYDKAFGKDFEDMQRRVPGIDKIQNLIGFTPETSLDVILSKVTNYLRKRTDTV